MATKSNAQRLLTLEELLPGGKNYSGLQPKEVRILWDGNTAVAAWKDTLEYIMGCHDLLEMDDIAEMTGGKLARDMWDVSFLGSGDSVFVVNNGKQLMMIRERDRRIVHNLIMPDGAENQNLSRVSRCMAYTLGGNLYVNAHDGTRKVTADGSDDGSCGIVYGAPVYRNEFGTEKGSFWNCDGTKLAFYRMDQSMVAVYPHVETVGRMANVRGEHYPMAGEKSHETAVGVYDVCKDSVVWLRLVGEKDAYHTNITWAPDGSRLYIQELNREQNHLRIAEYDAESGELNGIIYEERSDKYVEPMAPLTFVSGRQHLIVTQSMRDGHNHLYLIDVSKPGEAPRQLTSGDWDVQEVAGACEWTDEIVYLSNEAGPLTSCVFTVDTKGARKPVGEQKGVHRVSLSPGGSMLADTYSAPDTRRIVSLIDMRTGESTEVQTAYDEWSMGGYAVPEIECGSIKAADGETDLYYRLVKPIGFNPQKKYPAVVYVYGGPHYRNVSAAWMYGTRGWEVYMATKGFVVFTLDNRGSCWRGADFEQATYLRLGEKETADQMEGARFLAGLPYVDSGRMGVCGWSFGGYMTINMMCSQPNMFKAGVAGGPVISWDNYEVMYGERYMRTPQTNSEGYAATDLLNKAPLLRGKLQIIIGSNDDVVLPQQTLRFVRACIDAGKQPDLFLYPGVGHNMKGRDRIHLNERITQYFEDNLR